jgi:hypothetical protein
MCKSNYARASGPPKPLAHCRTIDGRYALPISCHSSHALTNSHLLTHCCSAAAVAQRSASAATAAQCQLATHCLSTTALQLVNYAVTAVSLMKFVLKTVLHPATAPHC